jgi:hypothetical protein
MSKLPYIFVALFVLFLLYFWREVLTLKSIKLDVSGVAFPNAAQLLSSERYKGTVTVKLSNAIGNVHMKNVTAVVTKFKQEIVTLKVKDIWIKKGVDNYVKFDADYNTANVLGALLDGRTIKNGLEYNMDFTIMGIVPLNNKGEF